MPVRALMVASITPLSDFTLWAWTNGLEIVMLISGVFIVSRASFSISRSLTARIDLQIPAAMRSDARRWPNTVMPSRASSGESSSAPLRHSDRPGARAPRCASEFVVISPHVGVGLGFGVQTLVQDLLRWLLHCFRAPVRLWRHGGNQDHRGYRRHLRDRRRGVASGYPAPHLDGEVVFVPNGQILLATNLYA